MAAAFGLATKRCSNWA